MAGSPDDAATTSPGGVKGGAKIAGGARATKEPAGDGSSPVGVLPEAADGHAAGDGGDRAVGREDPLHDPNDDDCYICGKGGRLICCDFCTKSFHLACHIPNLDSVPEDKKWRCCECKAPLLKKRQRCGECEDCTRADCGKCKCCLSKKAHGGDGSRGQACVRKRCKCMRYAAPEKTPNKNDANSTERAVMLTERSGTDDERSPSDKTPPGPGPGWILKRVREPGGKIRCHWISPIRKIEFVRRGPADEFEIFLRSFGGNEFLAWTEYRKAKFGGKAWVVDPGQYDSASGRGRADLPQNDAKSTSRRMFGRVRVAKTRKLHQTKTTLGMAADALRLGPPGPGWVLKKVQKKNRSRSHWLSPVRRIEFRSRAQADEFEEFRLESFGNEFIAWDKYRAMKRGGKTMVVAPGQYDNATEKQQANWRQNDPKVRVRADKDVPPSKLSRGWSAVERPNGTRKSTQYITPELKIRFRTFRKAVEFDGVLKQHSCNEEKAVDDYICMVGRDDFRQAVDSLGDYIDMWKAGDFSNSNKTNSKDKSLASESVPPIQEGSPVSRKKQIHVQRKSAVACDSGRSSQRSALQTRKRQRTTAKKGRNIAKRSNWKKTAVGWVGKANALRTAPPGPGWTIKRVEGRSQSRHYWMSPVRRIVFTRKGPADEFERFRKQLCGDEVLAWNNYRRMCVGRTWVVSPGQYDVAIERKSPNENRVASAVALRRESVSLEGGAHKAKNSPPGLGWKGRAVKEGKRFVTHWSSPQRNVEFTRHTRACEFEKLLGQFDGDEDKALLEYKKQRRGKRAYMIAARQRDNKDGERTAKRSDYQKTTRSRLTNAIHRRTNEETHKCHFLESPFGSSSPPAPEYGLNCDEIKITRVKPSGKTSFFNEMFRNRIVRVESSLNDSTSPRKTITLNGLKYSLASSKVDDNKQGGPFSFGNVRRVEQIYIRMNGLQKELEKLCGFNHMVPEKAVARLAHLQAEAKQIRYVDVSEIERIKEEGHEGCGFFPEGFFECDAIQVRIIGPNLGLAKGMLLKKRGITRIQLPKSMMKALPSDTCDENWAAIVVKNAFPSEENKSLGRFLDPEEDAAPSWKEQKKKALSKMYKRMLRGYGVKMSDVFTYAERSQEPQKLRHGM
ncbi:hypothetical protein ACHAWF_010266 [Thalassiosira exigua]